MNENLLNQKLNNSEKATVSQNKDYLVIGCLHAPYHNKRLLTNIYKLIEDSNFHGIVIAGDFLDVAALASYSKGKVIPSTLSSEYKAGNIILDNLGKFNKMHFMYGNHEERFNNYLKHNDISKLGRDVILSPEKALKLKERGYEIINNYVDGFVRLGDLEIIHGVYYNKHVSQKHLDVMKRNVMFVHTHRIQTFSESGLFSYNIGWLGNADSKAFKYRSRIQRENWQNGFAIVSVKSIKKAYVSQIIASKDGSFYANGKYYK